MKFELDKFGRNVTNKELFDDLREVASNLQTDSLTQKEYKKHGKFGVTIFISRFGAWSNASTMAGLTSSRKRTKITIDELVADLKRVSSELKNDSLTRDEYNQYGKFHSATLEERFGSWIKAKEKAGLKKREHPSISDEEYFINLQEVWIKLGKQPRFSDMKIPFSKYSGSGYVHNFRTWRNALEQFIEYVNDDEGVNVDHRISKTPSAEENIPEKAPSKSSNNQISNRNLSNNSVYKIRSAKKQKAKQKLAKEQRTKREVNDRLRFKVMRRDNFKCCYCGRSPAIDPKIILHVDHITPWSKDGETTFENLQTLCSRCNIGKGDLRQ